MSFSTPFIFCKDLLHNHYLKKCLCSEVNIHLPLVSGALRLWHFFKICNGFSYLHVFCVGFIAFEFAIKSCIQMMFALLSHLKKYLNILSTLTTNWIILIESSLNLQLTFCSSPGELVSHVLREEPVCNSSTIHDLRPNHFIHQHSDHLKHKVKPLNPMELLFLFAFISPLAPFVWLPVGGFSTLHKPLLGYAASHRHFLSGL